MKKFMFDLLTNNPTHLFNKKLIYYKVYDDDSSSKNKKKKEGKLQFFVIN